MFLEFSEGAFVVQKTGRRFSAMALDQAHEQENSLIKGEGGAVGLTNNPAALRRWMVGGPEISRLIRDFENTSEKAANDKHHEQIPSVQNSFVKEVTALKKVIEDLGSPFLEDSKDLLTLDSKVVIIQSAVECVKGVYDLGQRQYEKFVTERITTQTKSVTQPIKKNKLSLFSKSQLFKTEKSGICIEGRLCIVLQAVHRLSISRGKA